MVAGAHDPVVAHRLTKRFRTTTALADVSVVFDAPGLVGLLGRNGAGKTTLLRLVHGFDRPTSGSVRVVGLAPDRDGGLRGEACGVMESQAYPGDFAVRDVLGAAAGVYPQWDAALARRLTGVFGLPRDRRVHQLSRGMRSALGIVVGLSSRARLTCFDEPCVGLDPAARAMFYECLERALAPGDRTIVVSTHLVDEISPRLDRVLVLEQGRVLTDRAAHLVRDAVHSVRGPQGRVCELPAAGVELLSSSSTGPDCEALVVVTPGGADNWADDPALTVRALSLQEMVAWNASVPLPTQGEAPEAVTA